MTTVYSFEKVYDGKELWEVFQDFKFPYRYDLLFDIKLIADLQREYYHLPLSAKQEIRDILLKELDIRIEELDERIAQELEEKHKIESDLIMKFLNTDLPRKVQDLEPDEQRRIVLEWLDEV